MGMFEKLNAINVNNNTEKKNGLTYLSWVFAWREFKKVYPDAVYTVWKNADGLPYAYDPNTGYMCYVTVTAEGLTHEMWLPVMDGANKAMKSEPYTVTNKYGKQTTVEAATMFDINKTIMRALTKCLAMFGLGLYIYAGEDLPEGEDAPEPVIISREKPDVVPVSSQTYTELVTITTPEEREALEGKYGKLLNLDEQSILTLIKKIKTRKAADIKEETT